MINDKKAKERHVLWLFCMLNSQDFWLIELFKSTLLSISPWGNLILNPYPYFLQWLLVGRLAFLHGAPFY